ncbi:hypothetical protein Hanom_Chr07g00675511 [Helianthus anomalus]
MEFNNLNFHQLADNGPNFKNNHWRSQLLTFCKTLDLDWRGGEGGPNFKHWTTGGHH